MIPTVWALLFFLDGTLVRLEPPAENLSITFFSQQAECLAYGKAVLETANNRRAENDEPALRSEFECWPAADMTKNPG